MTRSLPARSLPARTLLAFAAAAMLAAGCSGDSAPATSDLAAAQFQDHAGCGDTFLYAVAIDGDTEAVLSVYWDGLLGLGVGEHTASIGDSVLDVQLEFGRFIANLPCNDVVEREPEIQGTGKAVDGTLVATVRANDGQPGAGEQTGFVDLTATDLRFTDQDGNTIDIDGDLVFTNVFVGWLAG